jgi:hypothetical protein
MILLDGESLMLELLLAIADREHVGLTGDAATRVDRRCRRSMTIVRHLPTSRRSRN